MAKSLGGEQEGSLVLRMISPRAMRQAQFVCRSAFVLALIFSIRPASAAAPGEDDRVLREQRVETITSGERETATSKGDRISIDVNERPLKQVLDYLSTVSGKNIRVKKEKDNRLLVTFKLENVTYRTILDFIAKKYGMVVDDSMIQQNIILLDTPEHVSMIFDQAEIRDVINTIAIQSNANIVVGPEVTGKVSMRLENVPWNDALKIVVRTLDFVDVPEANNTIRITSPSKIAAQLDYRIFRLAYISPEGSKYTAVLQSEFVKKEVSTDQSAVGSSLLDVLKNVKSEAGKIAFEKRSNALIVKDTPVVLDQMESLIRKLDVPPKQIHVSVKLVELTDADADTLGIKWGQGIQFNYSPVQNWQSAFPFDLSNGLSRSPFLRDTVAATAPAVAVDPVTHRPSSAGLDVFTLSKAVHSGGLPFTPISNAITLGSMGFKGTNALLQMISTRTNGRIIQSPQLIALDNEEATIQVGQLVRYAEQAESQNATGQTISGFKEAAGSPLKLGLQLLIIPHVTGPENNVLMTVIPKTEDFDVAEPFKTFVGPNGTVLQLPQTRQRIVVTKMMLRNGETGVIGGLRQETESLDQSKVPLLGDIPFIGRLFKSKTKNSSATNLLVFVTPTIIDFLENDAFKQGIAKLKQDFQKPFTNLGEEQTQEQPQ